MAKTKANFGGDTSPEHDIESYINPIDLSKCLNTGSTLLNCVLSNDPEGGIPISQSLIQFKGDSSTGKTAFAIELAVSACRNKLFSKHKIVYYDAEHGNNFDIISRFGEDFSNKIQIIRPDPTQIVIDNTLDSIESMLDKGESLFVIIDSVDSFINKEQAANMASNLITRIAAIDSGKSVKEVSTRMATFASTMSERLGVLIPKLSKTNSIMILLSQYRNTLNAYGKSLNSSGGNAIKFYRHFGLVFSKGENLVKKDFKGKEHTVGQVFKIQPEKNRGTGCMDVVEIPFYTSTGLSDNESIIDFLINYDEIVGGGGRYKAPWLFQKKDDASAFKKEIVEMLEDPSIKQLAVNQVRFVWNKIIQSLRN